MMNVLLRISGSNQLKKKKALITMITVVILCLICCSVQAQNLRVSGKVIDSSNGDALAGVSVYVPGTTKGVITDASGAYSMEVAAGSEVSFSVLGYETQTITIGRRNVVNVSLKPSGIEIEEVVAIGYGTVSKSSLTSSITTVSEKDLMKTPVNSIEQALQGNAAGVLVINTTAEPGGEVTMRIRGGSSISGSNEPLIVIDGFPSTSEDLQMLNPSDVKSMEVLKDASATAIYGSRGANGVIMVNTKQGEFGAASVSVKAQFGVQVPSRKLPMMDAQQYSMYDDFTRMAWGVNSIKSRYPDTLATSNFQDMLIKNMSLRQDYSVSVSGSSKEKEVNYYVSANYLDEQGILKGTSNSRMNYRGKFNIKLARNLTLETISSLGTKDRQKTVGGGNGAILRTLMMNPSGSYKGKFDGGIFVDEETGEVVSTQSEIARAMNANDWTKEFSASVSALLRWEIVKGLTFNVQGQYSYQDKRSYAYTPRHIYLKDDQIDKNNRAIRGADKQVKWLNENYLNYSPKLASKKHYLSLTLGQSWEERRSEGFSISVRRFDTDYYTWNNLAAAAYVDAPKTSSSPQNLMSVFFRTIYNFDKRFLTSLSIRTDGSSRFGEKSRYGWFPSASVAWVISNEKFLKGRASWLDELKARLSFGISGNNSIGNFRSKTLLSPNKVIINGNPVTGQTIDRLGNDYLQWETQRELDFGIDLSLLKSKIKMSIDIYHRKTYNQLYEYRVPQTTGYDKVMANVGSTKNQGIEFEITSRNITKKNFNWTTSFNIGYNVNKVTDLGGNDQVLLYYLGDNVNQNITYLIVGQPQAVFMGYKTSTYKNWDEVYADNSVWVEDPLVINTVPGMIKYIDQNGDGVINDDDKVVLGQGQPKLMGGFTNRLSFKGFDFTIFLTGAWGGSVVNANATKIMRNKGGSDNQMRYMLDVFRPMNPSIGDPGRFGGKNPLPSAHRHSTSTARDYTMNLTEQWIEDASYLRLKALTLSYNLPQRISKKIGISNVNIGVTAINLLTLTKYSGYDPEMSSSQGSSAARLGVDYSSYPPVRAYTINLNLKF